MKVAACSILLFLMVPFLHAQETPSKLINQLTTARNDSEKVDAYRQIYKYYQFSNPDSALSYLNRGTHEFKLSKSKFGIASMTLLWANNQGTHGQPDEARRTYNEALDMFTAQGEKKWIATIYNSLGVLDAKQGKYATATKQFLQALKLFEELGDINGIVSTYQKLGAVNEETGNYEQSLKYFFGAINQLERLPADNPMFIWMYNNIGVVYGKMNQLGKAIPYFELALKGSTKPELTDLRLNTLNNMGIVYDKTGNNAKSLQYFDEAIKLAKDKNLPETYARISVSRASVISKTDPAAAIATLEDALETAKSLRMKSLQADIYDSMMETYDRLKNYKKAFETAILLRRLEDSLTSLSKSKELMNLQAVYELEKSNAKLALIEEKQESSLLVRNIIICVAATLAIVLLLLLLVYRKSRILNKKLSKRERELQKSNVIKDRLFSIVGHDLRGPIGNFPVMLRLLNEPGTTEEERKFINENLLVHARATMETLDKLLFWGKTQIKGVGLKQSTFNVSEQLDSILELVKNSADQKQISITNKVAKDTTVFADPTHFDFVVRNLLSNAVKFTNKLGKVVIDADVAQMSGWVVFSIKDDGTGISEDKLHDLFEPFGISTRGTADEKGTSIGLMLCKEFITENGGEIWVKTEPGKGSTFYFSLRAGQNS